MKFQQRFIVLSGVLGVLVITMILGLALSPSAARRQTRSEPIFAVEADDIAGIEILSRRPQGGTDGGSSDAAETETTIDLSMREGAWRIAIEGNDFPANQERVESLVDLLEDIRSLREVSRDADLWPEFGLTKDDASSITLYDRSGEVLRRVYFGDRSSGAAGLYFRRLAEERVLLAASDITFYLDQGTAYFSDLVPMPRTVTADRIVRYQVSADTTEIDGADGFSSTYDLLRRTSGQSSLWVFEGSDQAVNQQTTGSMIRSAVTASNARFALPADGRISDPHSVVTLETDGGDTYTMYFGQANEEGQVLYRLEGPGVAQSESGEYYTYLMSGWQKNRILIRRSAILAEEQAAGPQPEGQQ